MLSRGEIHGISSARAAEYGIGAVRPQLWEEPETAKRDQPLGVQKCTSRSGELAGNEI